MLWTNFDFITYIFEIVIVLASIRILIYDNFSFR